MAIDASNIDNNTSTFDNPQVPEAIRLLIRRYAAQGKRFDGCLHGAFRHVALGERPSTGWSGVKEIVGVAVPDLRRELFRLLDGDARTAALAEAALNAIDELRDEYGTVEGKPRHPDVYSNRPGHVCRIDERPAQAAAMIAARLWASECMSGPI
jgi:hypothetical protein